MKIIRHTISLPAPADRLFDMYLDPDIHAAITGGPVTISSSTGSEFRAFDGQVYGQTVAVIQKKYIVQTWRSNKWKPEDRDSLVVLTFLNDGDTGKIELTHVDVPESDFEDVNSGWLDYYWKPWRKYLEATHRKHPKRAA